MFALTLVVSLPAMVARAAGGPQLLLKAKKSKAIVGEQVVVDVLVKHAPEVYGANVRLVFDPTVLEVVDADKGAEGIQVKPGKFLNPEKGFILQHRVDNKAGTIDCALTLLNPAPPAKGNGTLMQATFRAKAEGRTTISIEDGLFGTRTGETIAPALEDVEVFVVSSGKDIGDDDPAVAAEKVALELGGAIGLTSIWLVGRRAWLIFRKREV
jgi:hypothetical protein